MKSLSELFPYSVGDLSSIEIENFDNLYKYSEKAIQLQKMNFGPEMEPIIAEIMTLSSQIVSGVDSNGNQIIEPVIGEGGATTAYEYAYFMSEMPLLPGAHRIPPPADKIKK